jgi:hypothetical protein
VSLPAGRARLRRRITVALGQMTSGLAFAAAEFESARCALPRAVAPIHLASTAQTAFIHEAEFTKWSG